MAGRPVEDDKQLAAGLRRGLEAEGYAVDVALTGTDGEWFASEWITTSRSSTAREARTSG